MCRAGSGRAIPTFERRPTGFAGNPHGAYPSFLSRSLNSAIVASFFARMEQTSRKLVLGNRARVVLVPSPRASSVADRGSHGGHLVPGWKWPSGTDIQWI